LASSDRLIFLHGWGTDGSVWKRQAEYFEKKYNVATPVIVSNRDSDHLSNRDSNHFLNGRCPYLVIGWSCGGMRAIEMAAAEPEKHKALVLVASSAKFSQGMPPAVIKNIMRNLKKDFGATMKSCYETFFSDNENDFRERFINEQALPDKDITIEILRELLTMDLTESLKNIKVPTLIIHGDKDAVCPLEGGRFLREGIKGSRLSVIKDAGHAPFFTKVEEFNRILEGFLETLD